MIRKRIKDLQHEGYGAVRSESGDDAANVQAISRKARTNSTTWSQNTPGRANNPALAKWVHDNQKPLINSSPVRGARAATFPPLVTHPSTYSLTSMLLPASKPCGRGPLPPRPSDVEPRRASLRCRLARFVCRTSHRPLDDARQNARRSIGGISISNDACNGTAILLQEGHPRRNRLGKS